MINSFCNKKARLLWWSPVDTRHSTVMCQKLLRLSPCSEMRLIIQEKNFSVSDACSNTESIFMRTELNAIDTCICLVPEDASPLLLCNLLPDFDHTVIAARSNKIFKFRMRPCYLPARAKMRSLAIRVKILKICCALLIHLISLHFSNSNGTL